MEAMTLEMMVGRRMAVPPDMRAEAANKVAAAAKGAHEARRVLSMSHGETDYKTWEDAPRAWQSDSLREVLEILEGSTPAHPSASHERWSAQKFADGWKLGEVKDAEAKTHPSLVPFHALPVSEQAKDYIGTLVTCALLGLSAPASFRGDM